jgi:LysM repeat protein
VILTIAAPLVVGFTASGADSEDALAATVASSRAAAQIEPVQPESAAGVATPDSESPTPAVVAPGTDAPAATSSEVAADVAETTAATPAAAAAAALEASPTAEAAETAPVETSPSTTVAACGHRYDLAAGDYWIRIADAADVSLADLLDVNGASVDTVLVPGRSICLPVGASTPAPPTATVAATTAPASPSASNAPTTNRSGARAPATTVAPAPTTTVARRPAAVPTSDATAIIREIWPDELEERALEIAWRESNHRSNVNNFCCYGLFQIYFSVHRSWLATIGVNSADDLFDPRANALAAYTLYQRAGGWGPWGG